MTIKEMMQALGLARLTPEAAGDDDAEITQGYASDLLSDILAHAPRGAVLVTLQVHLNLIEVASHAGLRAVIFSSGRVPNAEIIEQAAKEGLMLFACPGDTFDVVSRLSRLGVKGRPA
jgi:hypothetical protein